MELLYTMNALESGPNDFKLITPSKYIVGKVGGGQTVTSVMGERHELPIRISRIPACCRHLSVVVAWRKQKRVRGGM